MQDCRMYENEYPEVDSLVMIQVTSIAEMGAYVQLLEYNNIEGLVLLSELSRKRIRSITKIIKVGRREPVLVLRVDPEKGYIDLSKRRVSPEDIAACDERYTKSKLVHSIMRHTADTLEMDLEDLYRMIAWPLYRLYGHAFEAFKIMITDQDSIIKKLETHHGGVIKDYNEKILTTLMTNIRRRMTPQPLKIRSDVELTCFQYGGIEHIKDAMRSAENASTDNCQIKAKLVAPPIYVLTTQTLEKQIGIETLQRACEACEASIVASKGKFVMLREPRVVSEREDRIWELKMNEMEEANREVSGDEDSESSYEEGMGDIDIEQSKTLVS
eukprot:g3797.t1